jgi:hypothetical protein
VNPNNGPRVEPLAILIGGPTGVGKSTFTVPFLLALMSRILPEDKKEQFRNNHNDFMFFRANENEFWDGYKMRNVAVVYDDFGQMKDAVGAPSADAFEIIRLKNTAPYHLHFAALEDKQRNYAVPKLIFATTNLQQLYFQGLTSSEAVARRFDLAYIQVPKKEFCREAVDDSIWARRLDIDKVRSVYPEEDDDVSSFVALDVAEFIPWDFSRGCRLEGKPTLGFWELLDYAEKRFNDLNNKGNKMLEFHRFMKENPRPQFRPEMKVPSKDELLSSMKGIIHDVSQGIRFYGTKARIDSEQLAALSKVFGVIGTVVGLSFAVSKILSPASSAISSMESGNSKNEVKTKTNTSRKLKARSRPIKRVNKAAPKTSTISIQSGDSKLAPYLKVLKRNMYLIGGEDPNQNFGWVTFIADRIMIMPRHFQLQIDSMAAELEEGRALKIVLRNPFTKRSAIVLDWMSDVVEYDWNFEEGLIRSDYIFMEISETKCRVHANITDCFVDEKKLRDGERYSSMMVVERAGELVFMLPDITIDHKKTIYFSEVVNEDHQPIQVYSQGLIYAAPTEKGDCGSLLMTIDPRLGRPTILGFHTAGSTSGKSKVTIGTYLSRQHVDSTVQGRDLLLKEESFECEMVPFDGFNALFETQQPRVPNETKIEPSIFNGSLWPTTTKPAHLRPFNGIDPAHKARAKYAHDEVFVDSGCLEYLTPLVASLVLVNNVSAPWKPRLFSFEEAVCGIDGVDFADAVNRSTSPGYPYILENKSKGKTKWLGSEGKPDLNTKYATQLKQNVERVIQDAKNGIRGEHIFVDYLKDERRPIEKVEEGKTRQFMACGMDLLIAMKMYFGDFIRHICANRIANGIAIGINPYEEWGTLEKYMIPNKETVFTAGDYSSYDARIPVPIGYEVLKIIEMFYHNSNPEDRKVRAILWLEIVNSLHLSNGIVYEFIGGNPSGQPLTSCFNSVANLLMIAYMGLINYDSTSNTETFEEIFLRTRFSVFGDDNIIGLNPKDTHIFGQQALERIAESSIGMTYTNESKDGKLVENRKINEISFLKRSFGKYRGKTTCPLDISVLHETLSWHKKGSADAEMKLRIECVLAELAQHGKEIFERDVARIVRASINLFGYVPRNQFFSVAFSAQEGLAYF